MVAVDEPTHEEQRSFLQFSKEKGLSWWHWIDGFWLLIDNKDIWSADQLRDVMHDLTSGKRSLVMQIEEDVTWAGGGPDTGDKTMFRWLKSRWRGAGAEPADGKVQN